MDKPIRRILSYVRRFERCHGSCQGVLDTFVGGTDDGANVVRRLGDLDALLNHYGQLRYGHYFVNPTIHLACDETGAASWQAAEVDNDDDDDDEDVVLSSASCDGGDEGAPQSDALVMLSLGCEMHRFFGKIRAAEILGLDVDDNARVQEYCDVHILDLVFLLQPELRKLHFAVAPRLRALPDLASLRTSFYARVVETLLVVYSILLVTHPAFCAALSILLDFTSCEFFTQVTLRIVSNLGRQFRADASFSASMLDLAVYLTAPFVLQDDVARYRLMLAVLASRRTSLQDARIIHLMNDDEALDTMLVVSLGERHLRTFIVAIYEIALRANAKDLVLFMEDLKQTMTLCFNEHT